VKFSLGILNYIEPIAAQRDVLIPFIHSFFSAMNKTNAFDSRLAIVKNALKEPSTKIPPTPKDRAPRLYPSPKKTNQCLDLGFTPKTHATEQQLAAFRLWKSAINMIGSFIERSPETKQWKRSELREFITELEICLEIKPGKLTPQQYGNLMVKLDAIATYKDGELSQDLEALDQIVQAYGNKLAQE
jgi:hypothetical protein